MDKIVKVHFPDMGKKTADNIIETFYRLRSIGSIEKKPATRELINWIRALSADPEFDTDQLRRGRVPFLGVLFKRSEDLKKASETLAD